MYILIFEVWPEPEYNDLYLQKAAEMKAEVQKIQGFVSVERFRSIYEEDKLLSLSVWESKQAIKAWREHSEHKIAQELGKSKYFKSYRIRIAEVYKDYGMNL